MAEILWEARRTGTPLDAAAEPWSSLTHAQALSIADALYARGGTSRTWKLGALDKATQRMLGLDAPVCVPLLAGVTESDVVSTRLSRDGLVAPRFEVEIGVRLDGPAPRAVPCVEVADCRFAGWRLPPYGMTADLALQGRMIFGPPGEAPDVVEVAVAHEGREVGAGAARWDEAVARLELVGDLSEADQVATGTITELFDCRPGRWDFDFGALGRLTVTVD